MTIELEGHKRLVFTETGKVVCIVWSRLDALRSIMGALRTLKIPLVTGRYRMDTLVNENGALIWRSCNEGVDILSDGVIGDNEEGFGIGDEVS